MTTPNWGRICIPRIPGVFFNPFKIKKWASALWSPQVRARREVTPKAWEGLVISLLDGLILLSKEPRCVLCCLKTRFTQTIKGVTKINY